MCLFKLGDHNGEYNQDLKQHKIKTKCMILISLDFSQSESSSNFEIQILDFKRPMMTFFES